MIWVKICGWVNFGNRDRLLGLGTCEGEGANSLVVVLSWKGREAHRAVIHGLVTGTVAGDGEHVAVVGHRERARPRRHCREHS